MDNNQYITGIVENLVQGIESRLESKLQNQVNDFLDNKLATFDFENTINLLASLKIDNTINDLPILQTIDIEGKVNSYLDTVLTNITTQAKNQIVSDVARKIDRIDFNQSLTNAVAQQLEARLQNIVFPNNSINWRAIDSSSITLNGDQIRGGIITNFGSTGIDDRATSCQITVLDQHTVVENKLVTTASDIRGTLTVDGDFILKGAMPVDCQGFKNIVEAATIEVTNGLDEAFFKNYSEIIFNKIREEGLDLEKITIGGEVVIEQNSLAKKITASNLQKLGRVQDLQSQGETWLSETLYTSSNRVGINTLEPSHALSIWDQEVEIIAGKRSQDVAILGTVRHNELIVTSNNKKNIICYPDGLVKIDNLQVGSVKMNSADQIPNNDEPKGTIIWNSVPEIGKPIGWVSLGGARWAKFGTLQD